MGVEEPQPRERRPEDDLLGFRNRLLVAIVFTTLYTITFGSRTGWLPGIVSGVLGGAVIFLLLKEVDERRKRKTREREQYRR